MTDVPVPTSSGWRCTNGHATDRKAGSCTDCGAPVVWHDAGFEPPGGADSDDREGPTSAVPLFLIGLGIGVVGALFWYGSYNDASQTRVTEMAVFGLLLLSIGGAVQFVALVAQGVLFALKIDRTRAVHPQPTTPAEPS